MILVETGILNHIMESTDKIALMQTITGLFNFLKEETRRNPFLDVAGWVNTIALMKRSEISLPLVQATGNDKGVNLMTAHGLEFEWIFLMGCNSKLWEEKRAGGGKFTLPDNLTINLDDDKEERICDDIVHHHLTAKEAIVEELRRLFYVALTRAKRHLQVSYAGLTNEGKPYENSQFVAELRETGDCIEERTEISEEDMFVFQGLPFGKKLSPEISQVEQDFIKPILDKFVMNVTALNNNIDCPPNFYFNYLIRIPAEKSGPAVF